MQILELTERELKIIIINMLRALMEKVDNIEEKIGNIGRKMKTKNQKEILEIKNSITEM